MLKKSLLAVIVLVLAVGGINAQQDTIKIGAIFDLSGPTADVGKPYAEGVMAYVDWVNDNGGIAGRIIELISADYAYRVERAESLYSQFAAQNVVAFMGWGTEDSEALRQKTNSDERPFMSASYAASLNDPRGAAPYNFLVGTTYSDQLVIMLHYMLQEWTGNGNDARSMRVAVFHYDSPFGESPLADGSTFANKTGIAMLAIPMPLGATDLTNALTQAASFGATHAIIQNVSTAAALLLRNAEDIGLLDTIQFACLNWCADELLVLNAGEAAESVLGAMPFVPTTVEVPGQEEPKAWLEANTNKSLKDAGLRFTQGWWSMAVMAEGIRLTLEAGQELNGANLRKNLESITDFDTGGITSPITFTADDHRGSRSLIIFKVERGVWKATSPVIDLKEEQ